MQKKRRLHTKNSGAQLQYFSEIKAGDYVVHSVHGIGRYIGVENVLVDGVHRDYLLLAYAGDDKLYVPVEQVGMLHKYVGNEGQAPRLSKMGGADWKRVQSKARAAITELAEELLRLYAQRKIILVMLLLRIPNGSVTLKSASLMKKLRISLKQSRRSRLIWKNLSRWTDCCAVMSVMVKQKLLSALLLRQLWMVNR